MKPDVAASPGQTPATHGTFMARKTRNHQLDLPPLELDCMSALWRLGQGTVREVQATISTDRPLAYTTVMTVMGRLARKGIVERRKRGRAHVYRPAIPQERVRDRAVDQLTRNFFSGSRDRLRDYLKLEPAAGSFPGRAGGSRVKGAELQDEDLETTLL